MAHAAGAIDLSAVTGAGNCLAKSSGYVSRTANLTCSMPVHGPVFTTTVTTAAAAVATDLSADSGAGNCLAESSGYVSRTANLTSWLSSVRGRRIFSIKYS